MNIKKFFCGPFILLTAAVIWGASFIFQRNCMQYIGPFTLNCLRMYIGFFFLLPFALRSYKRESTLNKNRKNLTTTLKGIITIGFLLFIGTELQQYGLKCIEAGKVGFITALYMILVPIFELTIGKRIKLNNWVAVILGLIGLYLICVGKSGFSSMSIGETVTLLCSLSFAFHIVLIDVFADKTDPLVLSCGQFFIAAIFSTVPMLIFEGLPEIQSIKAAIVPILYAGIMSSGVAFTLQIIGQKNTEPAIASLLLCTESLFSVLFSIILPPHEKLASIEYIGCGIMFTAVIIAQLEPKKEKLWTKE